MQAVPPTFQSCQQMWTAAIHLLQHSAYESSPTNLSELSAFVNSCKPPFTDSVQVHCCQLRLLVSEQRRYFWTCKEPSNLFQGIDSAIQSYYSRFLAPIDCSKSPARFPSGKQFFIYCQFWLTSVNDSYAAFAVYVIMSRACSPPFHSYVLCGQCLSTQIPHIFIF